MYISSLSWPCAPSLLSWRYWCLTSIIESPRCVICPDGYVFLGMGTLLRQRVPCLWVPLSNHISRPLNAGSKLWFSIYIGSSVDDRPHRLLHILHFPVIHDKWCQNMYSSSALSRIAWNCTTCQKTHIIICQWSPLVSKDHIPSLHTQTHVTSCRTLSHIMTSHLIQFGSYPSTFHPRSGFLRKARII